MDFDKIGASWNLGVDTSSIVVGDYSERIPYCGDVTTTLESCIGLASGG